jgi:hypothetical protein
VECEPTASSIRQSGGIEAQKMSTKYVLKTDRKEKKEQNEARLSEAIW